MPTQRIYINNNEIETLETLLTAFKAELQHIRRDGYVKTHEAAIARIDKALDTVSDFIAENDGSHADAAAAEHAEMQRTSGVL